MCNVGLFAYFKDSDITIGDRCNLNGTIIFCRKKVQNGDYCMIGPGVLILGSTLNLYLALCEKRQETAWQLRRNVGGAKSNAVK